jgi:hypothetical protein
MGDEFTEQERDTSGRWAVAIVVAILVVSLIAFARGPEHRRGDEIGAQAGDGTMLVSDIVV